MADLKGMDAVNERLKASQELYSKTSERVSKLRSELDHLERSNKKFEADGVTISKTWDTVSKKLNRATASNVAYRNAVRSLNQTQRSIEAAVPKSIKNFEEYNKHLGKIKDTYKNNLDAARLSNKYIAKHYDELIKKVDDLKDAVASSLSEPMRLQFQIDDPKLDKDSRMAAVRKQVEGIGGGLRSTVGGAMGAVGVKSKTMTGAADAFSNTWESSKKMSDSFKDLTGRLGAAGKGANLFIGALNALGMAFKANPIGLVLGIAKAFISVINEFDQMIKGLNKSWKEMAGSPMLLKDVRGGMKAFNDSIYNLDRNMRLGLKASNIQEFFKTMSSAGLSTEGVSKRIGNFNSAIEEGYKLSLTFGVSFSDMGQMMSSQMLDLRSSLDEVSDAFKGMSYDAAIAGVQSQKFYQVVESASTSLSFYGNFLDSTSNRLRDFVQTGVMGFKDASQMVQDLAGTFKGMGMDQRRALVNIIGEGEVTKMFKERLSEMNDEITRQSSEATGLAISKGEGSKEYKAAKMRLDAMRGDARNLREALKTGDVTALGSMLEVLSDKVMGAAAKVLERTGVDFFKDKAAAFAVLQNQFGWSIDMVNKAFKKANISIDIMNDTFKPMGSVIETASDETKAAYTKLSKQVRAYAKDPATSPYSSFEAMMDDVKKTFKDSGLDENIGGPMMDLLSQSELGFADFMDKVLGKSKKSMESIAMGASVGTRVREDAKMTENQMDDLIKQTTPLADYLEIGKENVKYALASSNIQNSIALGVTATARSAGGIFKFLSGVRSKESGGKKRIEEYDKKRPKVQAMMERSKMLEKLIEMASDKNLTMPDDQREKMIEDYRTEQKYLAGELEKTSNAFSDVQLELDKTKDAAYDAFGVWSQEMQDAEKIMLEQKSTYADLDKRIKDGEYANEEERLNLVKKQAAAAKAYNEQVGMLMDRLMHAGGKSMEASKGGKTGEFQTANVFSKTKLSIPEVKDFYAKSGGLVNVSSGDRIVKDQAIAKGIAMGSGQMMNYGAGIMKGGGGGGGFSMGDVYLNFNAPVNGDPEEYRRMFISAVESVVNKRLYENKSRVA